MMREGKDVTGYERWWKEKWWAERGGKGRMESNEEDTEGSFQTTRKTDIL